MPHRDPSFVGRLGTALEKRGFEIDYLPKNERALRELSECVPESRILVDYLDHEPQRSLGELCDMVDISSVRDEVFPQMVYDFAYSVPSYRADLLAGRADLDFDRYRRLLHKSLDYLVEYYAMTDSSIPLQHVGSEVLRRALQRVADAHGVASVWVGFSPIPGRASLYRDESVTWDMFETKPFEELTADEKERARELIRNTKENTPVVGDNGGSSDGDDDSVVVDVYDKLKRIAVEREEVIPEIKHWIQHNVVRQLLEMYANYRYLSVSESAEFITSEEFVFFPLQFFRESRVTVRAKPFYNQSWLVEYLFRSVPTGYKLAVKDHPQQLGSQPRSCIDAIARHSTALHPGTNAHDVVEEAAAIVTLNNTVGYEALIHGKPVVTLGDAFYSHLGYTYDVTDLASLPETLAEAVASDGLTESEVVEFAHGILSGSVPGEWGDPADGNVRRLANSLTDDVA
jgi:hypothetical protein